MQRPEFEAIVERALRRIPRAFRRRMQNLVIIVEEEGPPGLLGLYEGQPLVHRSVFDPYRFPDRIVIFQRPHERLARNPRDLEELVYETLWHEIGHYFGLSERAIRAAERRRRRST